MDGRNSTSYKRRTWSFTHCSKRATTFFPQHKKSDRTRNYLTPFTIGHYLWTRSLISLVFLNSHDPFHWSNLTRKLVWIKELDLKVFLTESDVCLATSINLEKEEKADSPGKFCIFYNAMRAHINNNILGHWIVAIHGLLVKPLNICVQVLPWKLTCLAKLR